MKKLIAAILITFVAGCSTVDPNNAEFYGKVKSVENQAPIPVEIARQIQAITETGAVVYQNDFLKLDDRTKSNALRCLESETCILKLSHDSSEEYITGAVGSEILKDIVITNPSLQLEIDGKKLGADKKQKVRKIGSVGLEIESSGGPLMSQRSTKAGPLRYKKARVGLSGNSITYIVKKGDTLMEIAFEKYADYLKWRNIYKDNKSKISSPKRMQIGTNLIINNYRPISIRKVGSPYLIKKSDTLKSISKKLYGSESHWQKIWRNNPELIRNPSKIYHGFTLYYEDLKEDFTELDVRTPAQEKEVNDNK